MLLFCHLIATAVIVTATVCRTTVVSAARTVVSGTWCRTTVISRTRSVVVASHVNVPLAVREDTAIGTVTSLGTYFSPGEAQIDSVDSVILASGQAHAAVNTVSHSACFFLDARRLSRHR